MVEAAGQRLCLFRDRLDYAITLAILPGCGACYPELNTRSGSWGRLDTEVLSRSMSLYRAGMRLALFLPLGVTSCRHHRHVRLHRCEPRYHFALSSEGDPRDRTRVRKHYIPGPTCLASSLFLVGRYPSGREDARPAQERFNGPALSTLDPRACERVPRVWMHKHIPVEG
jgi:hypothetical protein